jgi:hypothetical protein
MGFSCDTFYRNQAAVADGESGNRAEFEANGEMVDASNAGR